MSKIKTLVIVSSVLVPLAATGLSAGSAQAREELTRITAGELNSVLDRAEYTFAQTKNNFAQTKNTLLIRRPR